MSKDAQKNLEKGAMEEEVKPPGELWGLVLGNLVLRILEIHPEEVVGCAGILCAQIC